MGFVEAIRLVMRLWDTFDKIVAFYKAKEGANWEAKIIEGVKAYADWATAKTPQEKDDAQKAVAKSWLTK